MFGERVARRERERESERAREKERAAAVENRETAVGGRFYSQKTVGVVVDSRGERERGRERREK